VTQSQRSKAAVADGFARKLSLLYNSQMKAKTTKAKKPQVKARDLKPAKDAKGGFLKFHGGPNVKIDYKERL
jgi:hypothetical protein